SLRQSNCDTKLRANGSSFLWGLCRLSSRSCFCGTRCLARSLWCGLSGPMRSCLGFWGFFLVFACGACRSYAPLDRRQTVAESLLTRGITSFCPIVEAIRSTRAFLVRRNALAGGFIEEKCGLERLIGRLPYGAGL